MVFNEAHPHARHQSMHSPIHHLSDAKRKARLPQVLHKHVKVAEGMGSEPIKVNGAAVAKPKRNGGATGKVQPALRHQGTKPPKRRFLSAPQHFPMPRHQPAR